MILEGDRSGLTSSALGHGEGPGSSTEAPCRVVCDSRVLCLVTLPSPCRLILRLQAAVRIAAIHAAG